MGFFAGSEARKKTTKNARKKEKKNKMLLKTTGAAPARRQVGPARLPAVGPADEGPERLALRAPVIGRGAHRGHRVFELVAVAAGEMLALLEDHRPAFSGVP